MRRASPSKGSLLPQAQAGCIVDLNALLPEMLTFIPERLSEEEPLNATPIGSISSLRRLLSPGESILSRPMRGVAEPPPPACAFLLWESVNKV